MTQKELRLATPTATKHSLNNQLTMVSMQIQLLERLLRQYNDPKANELIVGAREELKHLEDLINS